MALRLAEILNVIKNLKINTALGIGLAQTSVLAFVPRFFCT
jgi:hypothetical protein